MTLEQLREIKEKTDRGELQSPPDTVYVNNHIHTTYSFSPYSPTKAIYMAWQNGLKTAGIMDHDSVGGAKEFLAAAEGIGMPVTCGVECRVDMSGTPLAGKRINNPNTHGTGCTLSSAIAANLAKGCDLQSSVRRAKDYISGALAAMLDLGKGSGPLNHAFAIKYGTVILNSKPWPLSVNCPIRPPSISPRNVISNALNSAPA